VATLLSPHERRHGEDRISPGRARSGHPDHGWGLQQRIRQVSRQALAVSQGSLYPALHRLEAAGLIESEMALSDNNRKARVYQLTPRGRRQLAAEADDWRQYALAIRRVLKLS
jgi:PadR family transcriptional regulator PadR